MSNYRPDQFCQFLDQVLQIPVADVIILADDGSVWLVRYSLEQQTLTELLLLGNMTSHANTVSSVNKLKKEEQNSLLEIKKRERDKCTTSSTVCFLHDETK